MRAIFLGLAISVTALFDTAIANASGAPIQAPGQEAISQGDADRGAAIFQQSCSACHTVEKGARRRVGPNLFGVAGARIASRSDYPYSDAFRKAEIVWDDQTLAKFFAAPMTVVPGTKMDWALRDEKDIANVIAYLKRYQ